ncbi:MAG: amidophosphoribosyltransferase [Spirochaetes bacterium]|uniref:Amidophosphoribosyltransferase n=1 Tax=Candidatus Gallitreponema excrementavium TaxID=2840840 RepID=A0A9D9HPK3_9SPIR|nr:amidophosphoribosyltransferase [Candidatus Gallitreponema excrementavium]
MGGLFGAVSNKDISLDLFFGIDYHSHLGTRRGGMAVYQNGRFNRAIHSIENSPFRTKFEKDIEELKGSMGIGCISDNEPQPLLVQSHLGSYAISTVGLITNKEDLVKETFNNGGTHFLEMSGGSINPTELAASIINQKDTIEDGIAYLQEKVKGSLTILLMTMDGIYAARDKMGRTPLIIGKKEDAFCIASESFSFLNLGYEKTKELGPGEILFINSKEITVLKAPSKEMKICTFLWVYYGYPTSTYEGVNVEEMRYKCGRMLAKRDLEKGESKPDTVAGVPDSGLAHAIGYANYSGIPFARPFIKYTPTWPRSFMPTNQEQRNLIAKMKLIPVHELIRNKKLLLIDDSIVRGTQLRETTEFLYQSGAKEVHVRPACPPILFGCKYLNFSRSNSEMDLITRRIIKMREGDNVSREKLEEYSNPDSNNYKEMVDEIKKLLHFTSLDFHRLDDMLESVGIEQCKLCTYCWNGKE